MYKKIIQYTLIAASIGFIGYIYFKLTKGDSQFADPYAVVSPNCSVILEGKVGASLKTYMPLLRDLSSNKIEVAGISMNPVSSWINVIASLDSLKGADERWNEVLSQNNFVFASTHQLRGDTWMLSLGLPENDASATANALMKKWGAASSSRSFKNVTIHQGTKWQYAVLANCLVIATSNAVMEDIIIRTEKKDLLSSQTNFAEARKSMSADIPIHFFFSMESGEWMILDPIITDDAVSLSGYAILNSPSNNSFSLTEKSNQDLQVVRVLPYNTSFLDIYSYDDFESGWKKHEDFHSKSEASKFWGQAWKDYGDTCACDLNDLLLSWRSGEWGTAIIDINDSTSCEVMFLGVKDSTDVISKLKPLLASDNAANTNGIHRLNYPQLFERNKPQSFLVEFNYIKQVDDIVFLATEMKDLLPLSNIAAPFSESNVYKNISGQMNHEEGRFVYQTEYYTSPLPTGLIRMLDGSEYVAAGVEHFKGNKYLVQIHLPRTSNETSITSPQPIQHQESIVVVTTNTAQRNWTVTNHNTQQKEKLIQNAEDELQLYASDGSLLWKKKINGQVLGEVIQIDALKNNKLQYAFTTAKALYIIDRNGNDLSGFPIVPKPPILSPLHIADYDKDKKYRLLFTGGDDFLYNYGVDGKKTIGWKGGSFAACYITNFKTGKEDFLLAASTSGNLQLMKRTGELRQEKLSRLDDYDGDKVIISTGDRIEETTITYTSKDGNVKTVNLIK